jgi:heparin binding hemagglutinin HbhA
MTLTTTITRSKPFYVAAGATDLAVKTIRTAPSRIPSVKIKVERRDLEKAVATVGQQAATLPVRAQATAVGIAGEVTERADAVYGDLLTRGRKVVGRIRRQKASQDLKKDAATTVRRTKATKTTAKKSAAATGSTAKKATKRTTTTAKKRATTTRTAAKGATTSARKTTKSAGRATTAGAAKVGS